MAALMRHQIGVIDPRQPAMLIEHMHQKKAVKNEPAKNGPALHRLPFVAIARERKVHWVRTLSPALLSENNLSGAAGSSTISPMVDDLHALKDDMNAFILGHGM